MVGMVTPQHIRERNLDHPSFDVVWREAERLGVPVCVHGGGQAIDQVPIGVDRWSTRLEVHAFTHPVGQMIAVMAFTVGGILHRFPKLRVAFLEAGGGWLPFWLERLDEDWELTPEQAPHVDRKPSEYFRAGRHFIGCDPGERAPARRRPRRRHPLPGGLLSPVSLGVGLLRRAPTRQRHLRSVGARDRRAYLPGRRSLLLRARISLRARVPLPLPLVLAGGRL